MVVPYIYIDSDLTGESLTGILLAGTRDDHQPAPGLQLAEHKALVQFEESTRAVFRATINGRLKLAHAGGKIDIGSLRLFLITVIYI